MVNIGGGYMADIIPCTVEGIKRQIKENQQREEKHAQEQFIKKTVPEILFWELGLEYIGTDIFHNEKKTGCPADIDDCRDCYAFDYCVTWGEIYD